MRFMVITKATAGSEAGVMPATEDFDTAGKFIEEMMNAGVLLAAEGIASSAQGARLYFDGAKTSVVDGPFTETKELVAGFFLVEMKSLQECVEWFKRYPFAQLAGGEPTNLEIRKVLSAEDFGDTMTQEQKDTVQERDDKAVW